MALAIAIDKTQNTKLGPMATTYACRSSCPDACPFKHAGACYGDMGPPASVWKRISQDKGRPEMIAREEAAAIGNLSGTLPLRLHTLGDCKSDAAARILAAACKEYTAKHGMPTYTFTHAWRTVKPKSWGSISVLASCESQAECHEAMARGYAPSICVAEHTSTKAFFDNGIRFIPCPKQTGKSESCLKCGLCIHADRLLKTGSAIMIAVHGPTIKAKKMLAEIA